MNDAAPPLPERPTFHERFMIKVFGANDHDLSALIGHVVRKHAPHLQDLKISIRMSQQGKYQAITATLYAIQQTQLDDIYLELSKHPDVLMVL